MREEPKLHWESYMEEVEACSLSFSERHMGEDKDTCPVSRFTA